MKKFSQSNESLYRRLAKEQRALKPINPIVDFYNAVSIKYGVTAGAFDLGQLQTKSTAPLELRKEFGGGHIQSAGCGGACRAHKRGEGRVGLCAGEDGADVASGLEAIGGRTGDGEDTECDSHE